MSTSDDHQLQLLLPPPLSFVFLRHLEYRGPYSPLCVCVFFKLRFFIACLSWIGGPVYLYLSTSHTARLVVLYIYIYLRRIQLITTPLSEMHMATVW